MASKFQKWGDTQSFHEVVKNLNYPRIHNTLKERNFTIDFGLKIKLHGTNACIRVETDGNVVPQKRSADAGFNGHFGFGAWVKDHEDYFSRLANSKYDTYIYGEWCGQGVQQGVACSMTDRKYFYVFSIDQYENGEFYRRIYAPDLIEVMLFGTKGARTKHAPDQMLVLPYLKTISINFVDRTKVEQTLSYLNDFVEEIGKNDPFMAETFGIDGTGEGVVAFPLMGKSRGILLNEEERNYSGWFRFKAKSEAHRVNKTKQATAFDPAKLATQNSFADMFCTEQRFEQAFSEAVERKRDMKLIPVFIKWVSADIFKESKTEREACPVEWQALNKVCTTRAALWYKAKVQELPQDA